MSYVDPTGLWKWPFDIFNEAAQEAAELFLNDPNGSQDAYRHCLASCENTMENGELSTFILGGLNELKGSAQGQSKNEACRDMDNNAMGSYKGNNGRAKSRASCQKSCQQGLGNGLLRLDGNGS